MRLGSVIRWEFLRAVRSKQYLFMSVFIPVIAAAAIIVASSQDRSAAQSLSGPPPAFVVALILAMILFMGAFLNGVMALYGVVKEKQSRVVELVLSSISARQMMAGKVIGLGIAGLIQVAAWVAVTYAVASRFTTISLEALTLVHWVTYPLYFALGYLLIASIYAATGATMKDVQSGGVGGLVGFVAYVPIMFAALIIENPNHVLVRIASFFPPFTPSVMLLRLGTAHVPAWEVALSLAALGAGVVVTMRIAARVFELGLLMYGKAPSTRELWKWVRARRPR